MRICAQIIFLACCAMATARAQDSRFGTLKEICRVPFPAITQAGPMRGTLSICRLESAHDSDTSLCVVSTYEREYGPRILRLLEMAHSPIIEKKDDRISILYTSGANTTCVTEFSISSGVPKFISTETIAWNDSGVYRKSTNFARYSHLLEERDKKPNQPPRATGE